MLRTSVHLATVLGVIFSVILQRQLVTGVIPSVLRANPQWRGIAAADDHNTRPATARFRRWASAAFHFVQTLECSSVFFTTARECRALVTVPKAAMNIHIAAPSPYGKYRATLPDEPLTRSGSHEAVVVVDPYPQANFGHLVLVFYVDSDVSRNTCSKDGGIFLDNSECLRLALRRRCRNALERRSRRRNFARRCEINFLPVVHRHPFRSAGAYSSARENYLVCRSGLAGFGQCPALRPPNETSGLLCNPLRENTQRCSTTHETVRTSCRVFEICDQAIVISGGWNRQTTGTRHETNVRLMYQLLRRNGFKRRNIKIFFANGARALRLRGESPQPVHPAAMKLAFRYHMRSVCVSPHCADSLVLYLNNPAKNDGTMLLWDVNGDGLADDNEVYTLRELKDDLLGCSAKHVQILVDQSYAGEVAEAFRGSEDHGNVLVLASSRGNEYSFDDEYTRHWASNNLSRMCTSDIHEQSKNVVKHSSPVEGEGKKGKVRSTLFGAPCDVRPPFTHRELRQKYLGCQNLPTAVWLMQILRNSDDSSLATLESEYEDEFQSENSS